MLLGLVDQMKIKTSGHTNHRDTEDTEFILKDQIARRGTFGEERNLQVGFMHSIIFASQRLCASAIPMRFIGAGRDEKIVLYSHRRCPRLPL
jgi:hypothetical protein